MNDMLKQNTTLTNLILQGNNFDDNAASLWADIITVNTWNNIIFLIISLQNLTTAARSLFIFFFVMCSWLINKLFSLNTFMLNGFTT